MAAGYSEWPTASTTVRAIPVVILTLLSIIGGCVLLYYGAESLVVGAVRIAVGVGFPKAIAGLTLVAVGTSAPELFVNLLSASRGHTEFALSNISGSNLANLCIGFGVCLLIAVVPVSRATFGVDLLFLAVTPAIVVAVLLSPPRHALNLSSVVLLTIGMAAYGATLLRRAMTPEVGEASTLGRPTVLSGAVRFSVGSALLYTGAELVLLMSIRLAQMLEISEGLIGLTIVAAGTSVPDITASIVATLRKENDIAVGNLLGSNISNVLFVLNGTLWVAWSDVQTDRSGTIDYLVVLVLSSLFSLWAWKRQRLPRSLGGLLLVIYAAYLGVRVVQAGL